MMCGAAAVAAIVLIFLCDGHWTLRSFWSRYEKILLSDEIPLLCVQALVFPALLLLVFRPQLAVEFDLLSDEGSYPLLGCVLGMVSLTANCLAIDSSRLGAAAVWQRGRFLVGAGVRCGGWVDLCLLRRVSNTFRAAHVNVLGPRVQGIWVWLHSVHGRRHWCVGSCSSLVNAGCVAYHPRICCVV